MFIEGRGGQSPGVDLHEHPAAGTVDEHHPRCVHPDPVHIVNVVEGDGDRIAVKGVDARHSTIVMLRDTLFLKIRRHLCADKDGEANMCCRKWTGDDEYNMSLDLQDTYQQRRVISMPTNLLGWSQY